MQGQYHLQAPLGLNCSSSICLQEHVKEKQKKKFRNYTNQSLIAETGYYAWLGRLLQDMRHKTLHLIYAAAYPLLPISINLALIISDMLPIFNFRVSSFLTDTLHILQIRSIRY